MMKLNIQFFGGRGSAGGNAKDRAELSVNNKATVTSKPVEKEASSTFSMTNNTPYKDIEQMFKSASTGDIIEVTDEKGRTVRYVKGGRGFTYSYLDRSEGGPANVRVDIEEWRNIDSRGDMTFPLTLNHRDISGIVARKLGNRAASPGWKKVTYVKNK